MRQEEGRSPRDPRSRAVIAETVRRNGVDMQLECGHSTVRRPFICRQSRVICRECQAG